jgi:DNA-dependent RNA polymerase auxiliary subunit epsilon
MKYFLAHNETDVFHYGEITEEQFVQTGQPHLEFFNTLNELKERLSFFNIEYVQNISEETLEFPQEPDADFFTEIQEE